MKNTSPLTYPSSPDTVSDWISALDSVGLGAIIFSSHGKFLDANTQAIQLIQTITPINLATTDYAGLLDLFFEHALDRDSLPSQLIIDTKNHKNVFFELIKGKNNSYFLVQITSITDGTILIVFTDYTTIMQRELITHDIDWERNILLRAVENGETGILIFDTTNDQKQILFSNHSFCSMLDNVPCDFLGKSCHSIFPNTDDFYTNRVITRGIDENQKRYSLHISTHDNLGIIFLSDITEQKKVEEQILHMQRLDSLGQLAGGIAHDFNNILGIISGYSHLLKGWTKDREREAKTVENILSACARGTTLSGKLLALSRRKTETHSTSVIQTVLVQLNELLTPLLPANIALSIFTPDEMIETNITEDHLVQIFMNLVLNARDAIGENGYISIDVGLPNEKTGLFTMTIRDNGPGIPPDIIQSIFEPFFTTKEVGKGTGLGLSIVYSLVKQNKGDIQVVSPQGGGAKFILEFPGKVVVSPQEQEKKSSSNPNHDSAPLSLEKYTVLVVDDEEMIRDSLSLHFSTLGATVLQAESGDSALSILDDDDCMIDLLISDIRMPGLYGDELARLWRNLKPDTKIILMSGYTENRELNPDFYDSFLSKPIDYKKLEQALHALLKS